MACVILYKNFDASALTCGELTKNKAGGNQVSLIYNDNRQRIILQTPKLAAPFGMSEYVPDNNIGPIKYSLDASFKGVDSDKRLAAFYETVRQIDDRMIDLAVENSLTWFGKKMSKEVVEELYRPLIKPSKQPDKYAPTIKFKIRNNPNQSIEVFNTNRDRFDIREFQSGSTVKCIVDFAPVWFVNKQFGLTMTLIQLKVVSLPVGKLQGFAFQDDSDNEEDPTF